MAKHLKKFTDPFTDSAIPYLLLEVVTDGAGAMVDLICRFANRRFCALLGVSPDHITGKRFTRLYPADRLQQLLPLQAVAFSGSSADLTYTSLLGRDYRLVCFQPMYGLVSCILNTPDGAPDDEARDALPDLLPAAVGALELSRSGLAMLSFSQHLCTLTGRDHAELLDYYGGDFTALVAPEDRTDLLQALLDSARTGERADHTFRLLGRDDATLWVTLRAQPLRREKGTVTFSALLMDTEAHVRARERGLRTLRDTEEALGRYAALFDSLPGGFCVLRQTEEGLTHLRLSQGLAALLGYPVRELQRRLDEEPLWRLPAADREDLLSAARQAWTENRPLRRTCRLKVKGGDIRFALIEAVRQPQADGSALLFVSCTDVTAEKEAKSELEFRARLCDLLLDDPKLISFDYDPATDVSRIFRHDKEGRRITRVIPGYLHDLERSAVIHPADQKALAAAVRRAVNRPTVENVEYRGNYDGQGWRWYRISWISLFDSKGNVYRLVGRSQDITRRKASAQRFLDLRAMARRPAPGTLVTMQLDLTADTIPDARANSRHLTQTLFDNSADACLRRIRDQIPTEEQRQVFGAAFCREALLDDFHSGRLRLHQEHRFSPGSGAAIWVESALQLIEDPATGHATAFFAIRDVDSRHRREALLLTLAGRDYDLILTVSAATGHCRAVGRPADDQVPYRTLAARFRERFGEKAPTLEAVQKQLESADVWRPALPGRPEGAVCWSWLDREDQVLLLTLRDSGIELFAEP